MVAVPQRALLVGPLAQQAERGERAQALGQRVARDRQAALPLVEAAHAEESAEHDRHGPAVAQQLQAVVEGAGGQRVATQIEFFGSQWHRVIVNWAEALRRARPQS